MINLHNLSYRITSKYFLDSKIENEIPKMKDFYFLITWYYKPILKTEDRLSESSFSRDIYKLLDLNEIYFLKNDHYELPPKTEDLPELMIPSYHRIIKHLIEIN